MTEEQDKYQESIEDVKQEPVIGKEAKASAETLVEPRIESLEEKEKPSSEKQEVFKAGKKTISPPVSPPVSPAPAPPVPISGKIKKEVEGLKKLDRENQVKKLCELAFEQGLNFAIEAAKNLDNAYVLDELHDTLVDELREKLIENGELKQL